MLISLIDDQFGAKIHSISPGCLKKSTLLIRSDFVVCPPLKAVEIALNAKFS